MQSRLKRQMSLNLPQPVMDALVEEAERLDRSRSYVAERALRAYLKLGDARLGEVPTSRYRGPGHLEQTGYIPEGSSEERGSFDAVDEDELPAGMARNWKGLPE